MAVNRIYAATGLSGGTTGDLDTIDGADLADKDMAIVIDQTTVYFYALDADSAAAESSPDVISPDDNAGDKRWILQSMRVNDLTLSDDLILATDDVKVGDFLEVVGSAQFGDDDGTGADVTFYSDTAGDHMVFDKTAKTFTLTDIALTAPTIDATTDFTVGDLIITDGVITDATGLSIAATVNFNNNAMTNVDINSGTIDGVTLFGSVTGVSGSDVTAITGTAGDAGDLLIWNADGDAVSAASPTAVSDFLVATAADTWAIKTLAEVGAILEADLDHGNLQGLSTGADHSYINQDVTTTGTPTFSTLSVTDITIADTGEITLDSTPASDDTGTGIIVSETVDANATGIGAILVKSSDGNWDEADADAVATVGQLGCALEAGTGTKKILLIGFIKDTAWSWTVGSQLFVDTTTGGMSHTAPSGSGDYVQVVGYAWASDTVFFNPSPDYIEIA